MVFPEIPTETGRKVQNLFRSETRKKMAMEFLFFDHWPNSEEKKEIAARHSVNVTSVDKTLYLLRDNDFFTKDQGSIPLYRAMLEKDGVLIPVDDDLASNSPSMEENTSEEEENSLQVVENIPHRVEKAERLLEDSTKNPYANKVNALEAGMHNMKQNLENFKGEMRTMINKLSTSPPKDNPGLVNAPDNPELVQPESVEGRLERIEGLLQESGERDPFDDLSREQIIELIRSQPQELMTMANPRGKGYDGRVEGQTVTLRPMILMLTTYSQMLYERAVYDGYFEGTLSDFVNFAMEQYFTDRGWGLDWNKREPANRPRRLG